jgi:hypothetical protein
LALVKDKFRQSKELNIPQIQNRQLFEILVYRFKTVDSRENALENISLDLTVLVDVTVLRMEFISCCALNLYMGRGQDARTTIILRFRLIQSSCTSAYPK